MCWGVPRAAPPLPLPPARQQGRQQRGALFSLPQAQTPCEKHVLCVLWWKAQVCARLEPTAHTMSLTVVSSVPAACARPTKDWLSMVAGTGRCRRPLRAPWDSLCCGSAHLPDLPLIPHTRPSIGTAGLPAEGCAAAGPGWRLGLSMRRRCNPRER